MTRVTDNVKLQLLISYLKLSNEELIQKRYFEDKKNTAFDSIMLVKPFELILNTKPFCFLNFNVLIVFTYLISFPLHEFLKLPLFLLNLEVLW